MTAQATKRILFLHDRTKQAHLIEAVGTAVGMAKAIGCTDVGLYLPTRNSLAQPTVISRALGDQMCRVLLQRKKVKIGAGVTLRLVTELTVLKTPIPEALCAVYAGDRMLENMEKLGTFGLILAVPWDVNNLTEWVSSKQPEKMCATK